MEFQQPEQVWPVFADTTIVVRPEVYNALRANPEWNPVGETEGHVASCQEV